MGLVTLNDILPKALKEHYAVGHFNLNGILWAQTFLEVAEEMKSPLILATSDRVVDNLGGFKTIATTINNLLEQLEISVPIVLHLDHGQTIERCQEAIEAGYSSVMYDGSHFDIDKNIELTKKIAYFAHEKGCSIEAEVGSVGGNEDGVIGGVQYAKLEDCVRMVEEAKIDALAAALGSVHGRYVGEPKLGFEEMEIISQSTKIPLVLHGASGIPDNQIQKAIQLGHAKINVNTEFNIAWVKGLKDAIEKDASLYEPKLVQALSKDYMKQAAIEKIKDFHSNNKA